VLVSMPLQIVNRCCSVFTASGGIQMSGCLLCSLNFCFYRHSCIMATNVYCSYMLEKQVHSNNRLHH